MKASHPWDKPILDKRSMDDKVEEDEDSKTFCKHIAEDVWYSVISDPLCSQLLSEAMDENSHIQVAYCKVKNEHLFSQCIRVIKRHPKAH